jgi:hypothetical protein
MYQPPCLFYDYREHAVNYTPGSFATDNLLLDILCFFTQKRRAITFDLALGLGIPVITVILSALHTSYVPEFC